MNIDERLEALIQSVELLSTMHRDNEKRLDDQNQKFERAISRLAERNRRLEELVTEIAEGNMFRLVAARLYFC